MRTQEIVEAYGKTHIYMIGMDDNPQPKHIDVIIKNVKHDPPMRYGSKSRLQ